MYYIKDINSAGYYICDTGTNRVGFYTKMGLSSLIEFGIAIKGVANGYPTISLTKAQALRFDSYISILNSIKDLCNSKSNLSFERQCGFDADDNHLDGWYVTYDDEESGGLFNKYTVVFHSSGVVLFYINMYSSLSRPYAYVNENVKECLIEGFSDIKCFTSKNLFISSIHNAILNEVNDLND